MYLVSEVTCDNEWVDDAPTRAIIEITPELIATVLNRMEQVKTLKANEPSAYSLELFDYSVEYGTLEDDELPSAGWETRGEVALDETTYTEADTMVVFENSVKWTAYPKHWEDQIHTVEIYRTDWEAFAEALKPQLV